MALSKYYVQNNSDIENKKIEAAKKLYNSENYSAALKIYLDMANTSVSYKVYYEIGRCYYKMQEFDKAMTNFQHSIELERRKNQSFIFLGNLYFKKQDYTNAIKYWIHAYIQNPDNPIICLNLATSYAYIKNNFMAIIFYEKYIKYSKDKNTVQYKEIYKNISDFKKVSEDMLNKAKRAIQVNDTKTAMQALTISVRNFPINLNSNLLLGKLYNKEKDYLSATIYLKQAYCIDSKNPDTIELLSTALFNAGDFNGGYCCLKRLLQLFKENSNEYLEIKNLLEPLNKNVDELSYRGNLDLANNYFTNNHYYLSLFEYENCIILNPQCKAKIEENLNIAEDFVNTEYNTAKICLEKGMEFYNNKDFKQSNKYFLRTMLLAKENSNEYKTAKLYIINI